MVEAECASEPEPDTDVAVEQQLLEHSKHTSAAVLWAAAAGNEDGAEVGVAPVYSSHSASGGSHQERCCVASVGLHLPASPSRCSSSCSVGE